MATKSKPAEPSYSDKLDADVQLSTEEAIAAAIFDSTEQEGCDGCGTLSEEDCGKLGRDILKMVLGRFRPDLFAEPKPRQFSVMGFIRHEGSVLVTAKDKASAVSKALLGECDSIIEELPEATFLWNGSHDHVDEIK